MFSRINRKDSQNSRNKNYHLKIPTGYNIRNLFWMTIYSREKETVREFLRLSSYSKNTQKLPEQKVDMSKIIFKMWWVKTIIGTLAFSDSATRECVGLYQI